MTSPEPNNLSISATKSQRESCQGKTLPIKLKVSKRVQFTRLEKTQPKYFPRKYTI